MSIRDEMRERVLTAEGGALRKEMRMYVRNAELGIEDADVFGFVPYAMISKPIKAGEESFKEFIQPGAFSESLKGYVKMLFNHNETMELGNTIDGSLALKEEKDGIRFRLKMQGGEIRDSIIHAVDSGKLDGASVGFKCDQESWSDDKKIRYIEKGELIEISLCSDPAYGQASSCGKVLFAK